LLANEAAKAARAKGVEAQPLSWLMYEHFLLFLVKLTVFLKRLMGNKDEIQGKLSSTRTSDSRLASER